MIFSWTDCDLSDKSNTIFKLGVSVCVHVYKDHLNTQIPCWSNSGNISCNKLGCSFCIFWDSLSTNVGQHVCPKERKKGGRTEETKKGSESQWDQHLMKWFSWRFLSCVSLIWTVVSLLWLQHHILYHPFITMNVSPHWLYGHTCRPVTVPVFTCPQCDKTIKAYERATSSGWAKQNNIQEVQETS